MGVCIVSYVAALFYKARFFPALTLDYVGNLFTFVIGSFIDQMNGGWDKFSCRGIHIDSGLCVLCFGQCIADMAANEAHVVEKYGDRLVAVTTSYMAIKGN